MLRLGRGRRSPEIFAEGITIGPALSMTARACGAFGIRNAAVCKPARTWCGIVLESIGSTIVKGPGQNAFAS